MATPNNEEGWATPATRGDLLLLQSDLEGKIKDVRVDLADVRVEVASMDRRLNGQIARLGVRMAWMTVTVVAALG